jgi:hypothetical protein
VILDEGHALEASTTSLVVDVSDVLRLAIKSVLKNWSRLERIEPMWLGFGRGATKIAMKSASGRWKGMFFTTRVSTVKPPSCCAVREGEEGMGTAGD